MQLVIKVLISLGVIIFCTQIGRKFPSLAGLIATMPLTGLIVLIWLQTDNPGNFSLLQKYVKAALWGIIPSILFFATAYLSFRKSLPFSVVLIASFGVWLVAACFHQALLK